MKFILADDHKLIREGIKLILLEEFPDAIINEVGDVIDLLQQLLLNKYDIIISDITMPGLSGIEAISYIREKAPKTPILILSMHKAEEYAVRAIKNGAHGYITKEAASNELITAVKIIKSGHKYIPPPIAELLAETIDFFSTKQPHELLTDREFEVFKFIINGKTSVDIAKLLFLSPNTIATYKARILEKMSMKKTSELVRYAVENGLLE